jgi:hypothetical protein
VTSAIRLYLQIRQHVYAIDHCVGREAIGDITHWRGQLTLDMDREIERWIGQTVTILLCQTTHNQPLRKLDGVLTQLRERPGATDKTITWVVQSRLSHLQQRHPSRLLTGVTGKQCIHQLLSDYRLPYDCRMIGTLPQPEHWRQSPAEDDWRFLRRVLGQLGGYCWSEHHPDDGERLIIANHGAAHRQYQSDQPQLLAQPVIGTRQTPDNIQLIDEYDGHLLQGQTSHHPQQQWHGLGACNAVHANQLAHWQRQALHCAGHTLTVQADLPTVELACLITSDQSPQGTWLITSITHHFASGKTPYHQQLTLHPAHLPWRLPLLTPPASPVWGAGRTTRQNRDRAQRYFVTLEQHPHSTPAVAKSAWGASFGTPLPTGIHWPLPRHTQVVVSWLNPQQRQPLLLATLPDETLRSPVTADNLTQHRWQHASGAGLLFEDDADSAGVELFTASSKLSLSDNDRQRHLLLKAQGPIHCAARQAIKMTSQRHLQGRVGRNTQLYGKRAVMIHGRQHHFSDAGEHHKVTAKHTSLRAQQVIFHSKKDSRGDARALDITCDQSFLAYSRAEDIKLHTTRNLRIQGSGQGRLTLAAGQHSHITIMADGSIHLHAPRITCQTPPSLNGQVQNVPPQPLPIAKPPTPLPPLYHSWLTPPTATRKSKPTTLT